MVKEQAEFEEINLRDYLEVLFRRKGIILGIFLICVISTAVVSFFILKPVYQSTVRIIITLPSSRGTPEFKSYQESLSFRIFNPPVYSPQAYTQLLKDPSLEKKVIETLNLKDKKEISLEVLEKISSIQVVGDTRMIEINVEYKDPTLAKDIANTWAKLFVEENEKNKLQTYITLKNNLNKIKILELQDSIRVENAKVRELQQQLKEEKEVIILTESIAKHPLLSKLTNQIARDALSNLQVKSEYINPVYQDIKTQLGSSKVNLAIYQQELTQLKEQIQDLPARIEKLKKELSEEVITEQRINREFKLAQDTYNNLSYQLEQIKGAESIQREDIKITSLARAAKNPIKPNKMQNIAISGVLGLLIGIIAAFGIEWWSREKDKKDSDKNES